MQSAPQMHDALRQFGAPPRYYGLFASDARTPDSFWISLRYFNVYRMAVAALFLGATLFYGDALNLGYQEGYRAAQADRQDQWRYDYRNSYAYQDANYGYDDGYYSRSQYGTRRNGNLELVVALLDQILRLRLLG